MYGIFFSSCVCMLFHVGVYWIWLLFTWHYINFYSIPITPSMSASENSIWIMYFHIAWYNILNFTLSIDDENDHSVSSYCLLSPIENLFGACAACFLLAIQKHLFFSFIPFSHNDSETKNHNNKNGISKIEPYFDLNEYYNFALIAFSSSKLHWCVVILICKYKHYLRISCIPLSCLKWFIVFSSEIVFKTFYASIRFLHVHFNYYSIFGCILQNRLLLFWHEIVLFFIKCRFTL